LHLDSIAYIWLASWTYMRQAYRWQGTSKSEALTWPIHPENTTISRKVSKNRPNKSYNLP
jgi:hypothetical protein